MILKPPEQSSLAPAPAAVASGPSSGHLASWHRLSAWILRRHHRRQLAWGIRLILLGLGLLLGWLGGTLPLTSPLLPPPPHPCPPSLLTIPGLLPIPRLLCASGFNPSPPAATFTAPKSVPIVLLPPSPRTDGTSPLRSGGNDPPDGDQQLWHRPRHTAL
jgi:hypothetical protein